jgi:16S rRNA (cytosine1402-N4)-methyltransferase
MAKAINELHTPVALEYSIEMLGPALAGENPVMVDGTLGLGGHTEAFLERFEKLTVIGIDRDEKALELATSRLARFGARFIPAHAIYSEVLEVLEGEGIESVDAILLDLGVSSMQLDEADRGFAYSFDAPLDMRMNQSQGITAAEVLNTYGENELARIFKEYGEERYAKQVAKAIVDRRKAEVFKASSDLAAVVGKIVPYIPGKTTGHPAKRIFQALRIEVNGELEILEDTIPAAIEALKVGGRILVMSYHSLEDGIVKSALVHAATSQTPIEMPIELPEHAPVIRMLTKGTAVASDAEKLSNPRAASVRMRAAEKIREAA